MFLIYMEKKQRSSTDEFALLVAHFSRWGNKFKITCPECAQGLEALPRSICALLVQQ